MKYNLGKFNRKASASVSVTANATITVGAKIEDVFQKQFLSSIKTSISLSATSKSVLKIYRNGSTNVAFKSSLKGVLKRFIDSSIETPIVIDSYALGSIYGEEFVELNNIILRPGEELVINTCDLTATIGGRNAINLLTNGSDFFDFFIGENDITIRAENATGITVDTYWKDKWL